MITAVLTTYKPDAGFAARFTPLLSVCESIIVSDNTPGGHTGFRLPPAFTVIHNLQNIGLGPALNRGVDVARSQGARKLILFDQDSTPTPEFVAEMLDRLQAASSIYGPRCCVGPTHVDDKASCVPRELARLTAQRRTIPSLHDVSCLPTSGMVFDLTALRPNDTFADDLFLDLVDFEWCWRLRRTGWRFLRAPDLWMSHRLGEAERQFLGVKFHVPAPYRHYFQVRDTLRLAFRGYVPAYAKCRLLAILPIKALIYPFILDCGAERLNWMFRGAADSFRAVQGIGAAESLLSR